MVNYSKWDNIDVSDDEDDKKPRVQHFDKPQSVTIGGKDGVSITPQTASGQASGQAEEMMEDEDNDDEPMEPDDEDLGGRSGEDCREDVLECRALAERALRRGDAAEGVRLLEKAMRIGGEHCPGLEEVLNSARQRVAADSAGALAPQASARISGDSSPLVNGGTVENRYCWTQTQDTVEINVFVPEETKAKGVRFEVLDDIRVRITVNGAALLDGEWEFKIEPEEDPDWELKSCNGRRALRLLIKKAKIPGGFGVVVWWKRVLKGDPAIDVSSIQDRARKKDANDNFSKAWQEAHLQFKEKVKARQPTVIDA